MVKRRHFFQFGFGEWVLIGAFLILITWGIIERTRLNAHAGFSKGIITGSHEGVYGSIYLDYEFSVGDEKMVGSGMTYKNWDIGDTVIIKYNVQDPIQNRIEKPLK